jgi:hypothetical protein
MPKAALTPLTPKTTLREGNNVTPYHAQQLIDGIRDPGIGGKHTPESVGLCLSWRRKMNSWRKKFQTF